MKRRQKMSWFLSGMLAAVLLLALAVPAFAALTGKTISVYTGFSVQKDGVAFQPKDANGDPVELFAYNGTTYVPARAFSEVMGVPINYDGKTQTVYIGEVPGQKQYLLDVCPPYQTAGYETQPSVTMAGNRYTNSFTIRGDGFTLYNLNGQYYTLSFDFGHVDGREMTEIGRYEIYLDGKLTHTLELDADALPQHYEIPLNGALQMKIVSYRYAGNWAFAEVTIS